MVEPTGSETQVVAKLGGEEIIAVFRERHQFKPGDSDPAASPSRSSSHLFDADDRPTTDRCIDNHNGRRRP